MPCCQSSCDRSVNQHVPCPGAEPAQWPDKSVLCLVIAGVSSGFCPMFVGRWLFFLPCHARSLGSHRTLFQRQFYGRRRTEATWFEQSLIKLNHIQQNKLNIIMSIKQARLSRLVQIMLVSGIYYMCRSNEGDDVGSLSSFSSS